MEGKLPPCCLPLALLLPTLICSAQPTFYRDVLPILRSHCQECHRAGEIGPMPLGTYAQVRPWAKAVREQVVRRKMPPWFADPHYGNFSNNQSLSQVEIDTIAAWVDRGAAPGKPQDAPPAPAWPVGWSIGKPDAVFQMSKPFQVPANEEIDYQYMIVPTGFTEDRWVSKVQLRPGNRSVVHHAVVYVREPGSAWLKGMPVGPPFSLPEATISDILFTYTPGNSRDEWPQGMAKLIPAGSDLVFQMHYTASKRPALDQSRIGIVFARIPPAQRVLTLQLNDFRLFIPPGRPDYRVTVSGTLPDQARLLSLYPHMHLRGKQFEYAIYNATGQRETLLKVENYDFYWQLTYRLANPRMLAAGTRIECVALFDNSRNNPRNPDPDAFVRYGQKSTDEMMIGFFDVAVPTDVDKLRYFGNRRKPVD